MSQQLVDILRQAGFQGDALRTAYAVAMAESRGNARAFNGNRDTGDESYGLFQINMLGDLGPDRLKRYGLPSREALYDPSTNARIAYQMSGGGRNWQPWSAYKNGSYRQYLSGNQDAGVQQPAAASQPGPSRAGSTVATTAAPQASSSDPKMQVAQMLLRRSMQRRGADTNGLLGQLLDRRMQGSGGAAAAAAPPSHAAAAPAAGAPPQASAGGPYPYNPLRAAHSALGAPGQGTHSAGEGPDNWQSDNAWDYGAKPGTPVYATDAGIVDPTRYGPLSTSGRFGGYRLTVDGADSDQFYQHLAENLAVKPGQRVNAGDLLGYIGAVPGLAPHLHYGRSR